MLSSNMFGVNETNDTHKLLLTDRNVLSFCKSFANNPSTNMKISKWNCTYTIPQSVLLTSGLRALASAADTWIHEKILGSRNNNTKTFKWRNARYYENS